MFIEIWLLSIISATIIMVMLFITRAAFNKGAEEGCDKTLEFLKDNKIIEIRGTDIYPYLGEEDADRID